MALSTDLLYKDGIDSMIDFINSSIIVIPFTELDECIILYKYSLKKLSDTNNIHSRITISFPYLKFRYAF